MSTLIGLSVLDEAVAAVEERKAREKDEPMPSDGRETPKDGKCRRCGEDKPLNRHKLCYPCWVILEIIRVEKDQFGRVWREGDKHPDWCSCTLPSHKRKSSGN